MKNTKLILKHKNNTLTLVYRGDIDNIDRLVSECIIESTDKINVDVLPAFKKMIISSSTGLLTYMVDGYENENKNIFMYPPVK